MKRLKKLLIESNYSLEKKLDLRKKHLKLRELEGWFEASPLISKRFEKDYQEYKLAIQSSKTKLKFTKWLRKNKNHDNDAISKLGQELKKSSFKLSCKYDDILRVVESKHYNTCYNNLEENGKQLFKFICDPDLALIYVPDRAGHFQWRAFVRLVTLANKKQALLVYDDYGTANKNSILKELSKKIPVFLQTNDVKSSFDLISVTRINNNFIKNEQFSDLHSRIIENRFHFKGNPFISNFNHFEYEL